MDQNLKCFMILEVACTLSCLVIVRLPCAKVGAMPALVKTADSEEADFRDILTRVSLK